MPRKSDKAPKISVEELSRDQYDTFKGMAKELAEIQEKIELYKGTMNDIKSRCEEEIGVSKTDLNNMAKWITETEKMEKDLQRAESRRDMAIQLGLIKEVD